MKRMLLVTMAMFVSWTALAFPQKASAPSQDFQLTKPNGEPLSTLVNINNISLWVTANGTMANNPISGIAGAIFPYGAGQIIYKDGLVWAGEVKDGNSPIVRAGGQAEATATAPGRIISKGITEEPLDPDVRIWRIRRDHQTADLRRDAAEINDLAIDAVTDAQIQAVREQYETDWNEWPWERGAPFYDANANGVMDDGEEPGLANADQVVWFVANDLYPYPLNYFSSPPIGIEMQCTLWAYNRSDELGNIIFKRYRLIYKGTATTPDTARIDNMYLSQWSDVDVGNWADDFVGCDSLLSLGFGYNSSTVDDTLRPLGLVPPAVGYCFLQGAIVAGEEDDAAMVDFKLRRGYKNLPMTSFVYFASGDDFSEPRGGTQQARLEWYNLLKGFFPFTFFNPPKQFVDPLTNQPTKFPFGGDPLTGQGWVDGIVVLPSSRRFLANCGPFTLALGDTQEVIIALVGGAGADRIRSVQVMKHNAKVARNLARANFQLPPEEPQPPAVENLPEYFGVSKNFPNPFNARTQIVYELPETRRVKISIHNLLGQPFKILIDNEQPAGRYSIFWDGTDDNGKPLGSGIYFYTFDTGVIVHTQKMILLR
jgi:hypothetical protein